MSPMMLASEQQQMQSQKRTLTQRDIREQELRELKREQTLESQRLGDIRLPRVDSDLPPMQQQASSSSRSKKVAPGSANASARMTPKRSRTSQARAITRMEERL